MVYWDLGIGEMERNQENTQTFGVHLFLTVKSDESKSTSITYLGGMVFCSG